jgi:hypothetical protein
MPDDTLHPEDAAAMREPLADRHGELRQQLSNAVVALFKQYFGRGPTNCRTYLEPNLVIFVLEGGYTAAEQTLFQAGKWYEVRQARIASTPSRASPTAPSRHSSAPTAKTPSSRSSSSPSNQTQPPREATGSPRERASQ